MDNSQNCLITKQKVEEILNYYGGIGLNNQLLKVNNLEIYQEAFVHESYYQSVQQALISKDPNINFKNFYIPKRSSETLEFLGDHSLKFILGKYIYRRFEDQREGFMTILKIKIEKTSMLHKFAQILGFKKYLLLSLQIENQTLLEHNRGRCTPSFFEDAFEAFLGAIIEDNDQFGILYVENFIINIIENVIDFGELINNNDNFKDSLQRVFQQILKITTPVYYTIEENSPLYRRIFTRILYITKEQFNALTKEQQKNVEEYTNKALEFYKYKNTDIYKTIFDKMNDSYILCLGRGKKVILAEQECAKNGLKNLLIDENF